MITKQKILSVTAGMAIASSFLFGAVNTEAASYTVQKGDSLWSVSQKLGTSVSQLKAVNNIKGTTVYPNQVIKVASKVQPKNSTSKYTVKKGDSLSKISRQFKVSISNLKQWNNLRSDVIYPGQALQIKGAAGSVKNTSAIAKTLSLTTEKSAYDVNKVISIAKTYIGTPYLWGGTTPSGFDCSGFVYYVLNRAGFKINRLTAAGYYELSNNVTNPQPGDLIFFEDTYKKGISDMGIYLGNNQFISASDDGVSIKSLSISYWKSHFNSIKRIY